MGLMSNGLIAFLIALGSATWIYNKFMQRTGSLTQRSLTVAGISGLFIFFVVWLILGVAFH